MHYNTSKSAFTLSGFVLTVNITVARLHILKQQKLRINSQIRGPEIRVIGDDGETFGIISPQEAVKIAEERGLDLIEISPSAKPPVAKITDYGKFQYEAKKKASLAKSKAHVTETKIVQVKIATGEHDLELKAKRASEWLEQGHRVKIDLYLVGRAKYSEEKFKRERLERILTLIKHDYKIADAPKRSPKGFTVVIEKATGKSKQKNENKQILHKKNQGNKVG